MIPSIVAYKIFCKIVHDFREKGQLQRFCFEISQPVVDSSIHPLGNDWPNRWYGPLKVRKSSLRTKNAAIKMEGFIQLRDNSEVGTP